MENMNKFNISSSSSTRLTIYDLSLNQLASNNHNQVMPVLLQKLHKLQSILDASNNEKEALKIRQLQLTQVLKQKKQQLNIFQKLKYNHGSDQRSQNQHFHYKEIQSKRSVCNNNENKLRNKQPYFVAQSPKCLPSEQFNDDDNTKNIKIQRSNHTNSRSKINGLKNQNKLLLTNNTHLKKPSLNLQCKNIQEIWNEKLPKYSIKQHLLPRTFL